MILKNDFHHFANQTIFFVYILYLQKFCPMQEQSIHRKPKPDQWTCRLQSRREWWPLHVFGLSRVILLALQITFGEKYYKTFGHWIIISLHFSLSMM